MGMDFSGFIKAYLYKFNNELKESLKDKSIIEKEEIFLEKITSLFLSKYILIILSEKQLNSFNYFVNISLYINKNFFSVYFPFLDDLILNNFSDNILKYSEKDDAIFEIIQSMTDEIKDLNVGNMETEKLEKDLYTNNDSNLIKFYSTILKSGIDFLTNKKEKFKNIIDDIIKSSELLNIQERKMILDKLIETQNLKKSNYIQQILILILIRNNDNNKNILNELIEKEKRCDLIKILERIKLKDNELQFELSEFITNSKNINIDNLIKEIESQSN